MGGALGAFLDFYCLPLVGLCLLAAGTWASWELWRPRPRRKQWAGFFDAWRVPRAATAVPRRHPGFAPAPRRRKPPFPPELPASQER
jgi:hypothetical protein